MSLCRSRLLQSSADVVQVSRDRGAVVTLEQIAADIEIHPMTLPKWMYQAYVDDGVPLSVATAESAENLDSKANSVAGALKRGVAAGCDAVFIALVCRSRICQERGLPTGERADR